MTVMLKEVGFWCSATGDDTSSDRPDPQRFVDDDWFAESVKTLVPQLEWYLTRGAFVESHEFAYSFCRFPDCVVAQHEPKVLGACTMTDGVYCWPEGYWHYINHHHVKPPDEFLQHVNRNYTQLKEERRQAHGGNTSTRLLMWDSMENKAVPMPAGMQEWITSYATIQVEK